jgi:hypothetical protein
VKLVQSNAFLPTILLANNILTFAYIYDLCMGLMQLCWHWLLRTIITHFRNSESLTQSIYNDHGVKVMCNDARKTGQPMYAHARALTYTIQIYMICDPDTQIVKQISCYVVSVVIWIHKIEYTLWRTQSLSKSCCLGFHFLLICQGGWLESEPLIANSLP